MYAEKLCPPALIYLVYSLVQIVIDTLKGMYNTAFIKVWIMLLFTALLNVLCQQGLGIVSWVIVFLPFVFMALITTILLFNFGLDPASGTIYTKRNEADVITSNTRTSTRTNLLTDNGLTHAHLHDHANGINHKHMHTHPDARNITH